MSLDPKSLKVFVSVVQHGTIAAAAEAEHLAAAAVSRRLSDLEALLDAQLLVRSNKGVQPTPAGRALMTLSHRLLNDIDDIRSQMRDYATGMKGYVRVFANISSLTQFLPHDLSRFMARNPNAEVHLEDHVSADIAQAVAENQADVGVLIRDASMTGVEFLPYREDELVLIVAHNHALAQYTKVRLEQTLGYDYVGLPAGSQLNDQLALGARSAGRGWKCKFYVPSYDVLCLMVEAGLGVGIIPRRLAQTTGQNLAIRMLELDEPWARRQLDVCIRDYDALSPTARRLVDCMTAPGKQAGLRAAS